MHRYVTLTGYLKEQPIILVEYKVTQDGSSFFALPPFVSDAPAVFSADPDVDKLYELMVMSVDRYYLDQGVNVTFRITELRDEPRAPRTRIATWSDYTLAELSAATE